jgi:hypothetical protein
MIAQYLTANPNRIKIMGSLSGFTTLVIVLFGPLAAQEQKLKVEELIQRHLAAIGSAEARAAAKTRLSGGEVIAVNRIGPPIQLKGDGTLISSGTKLRLGMKFSETYAGEQIAYNGKQATHSELSFGRRSSLTQYIFRDELPLTEGLLGGALSTAWPLLRLDQQQPRLTYKGIKKVKDREFHTLNYQPRRGAAGLEVTLFFDTQTYRHVQTQYRSEYTQSKYYISEEFEDFRAVDGLTLPHQYKLTLNGLSNEGTFIIDWTFQIAGIAHGQSFDDQVFKLKKE